MKIAVLYGGTSKEREVSLSSGKGIIAALEKKGYEIIGIDFNPNQLGNIIKLKVDHVFIGLHGRYGEDGRIQGLLDMLELPYVGSGVLGSSLAMDKAKSKKLFESSGIRIANSQTLYKENYSFDTIKMDLTFPVVVKPNQEGSTIGLTIAESSEQLREGIQLAFEHDEVVLVEEFIKGKEVTVAVYGKKMEEKALPVVEIVPKNRYYDYEAKYAPGGSEHFVPARVSDKITEKLQEQAVKAHQVLDCETYSRVDFIVPCDGTDPVILEVNTLPGMTPTSLFPDAAKAVGISYDEMINQLVQTSISNYERFK